MDPQTQFCPNEHCRDRGIRGQGTIRIHSYKEGRYRCHTCGGTFGPTTGTAFFRLRTPATVVTTVVTLLSHGCPLQAIVAAFAVDERTVAAWQQRAGAQCQRVHDHLVPRRTGGPPTRASRRDRREDVPSRTPRGGREWGRAPIRCSPGRGRDGARLAGHGHDRALPPLAGWRDQCAPRHAPDRHAGHASPGVRADDDRVGLCGWPQ